jgi:hypothetical protein
MELGLWTECLGRLAVTPEQASALLSDAVAIESMAKGVATKAVIVPAPL